MKKIESLPEILKSVKFYKADISVNSMTSGISSQRKIDPNRVAEIYNSWSAGLANPIKINALPGSIFKIVDGQHTWSAYKMRLSNGLETSSLFPCVYAYNLTPEQENAWLLYEDGKNKDQPNSVKIKAHIAAKDPDIMRVIKTLGTFGYTIPYSDNEGTRIECVDTLLSISPMTLVDVIYTVYAAYFYTDNDAIKAPFLKGLATFYDIYGEDIDRKRLISKLSKERPAQLLAKAKIMNHLPTKLRLPSVLVPIYNKGLRKEQRLNEAKLYM